MDEQIVSCEECPFVCTSVEAWDHVQETGHHSWTLGVKDEEEY